MYYIFKTWWPVLYLCKYEIKKLLYFFQKIIRSKDAEELIKKLQELASKGVLIAEKASIFENMLVTFLNYIKLIKQVDSNGYAYDLYLGSTWFEFQPWHQVVHISGANDKFKSVIKCVLIILNMVTGWVLTVIQKRRTNTIKMIIIFFQYVVM